MPRLRVSRTSLERVSGARRLLWEKLEIDPEPRVSSPDQEAQVVAFVEGRETFIGPMPRLLESLGLTREDLEEDLG